MRLLASYNSGPGNFGHWVADMHDDGDPLLFIEAIPIAETRAFVRARADLFVDLRRAAAPAGAQPGCPGGGRIPPLHAGWQPSAEWRCVTPVLH